MWNGWVSFPDSADSSLGLAGGLMRAQRQPEVPRPGEREREEMIFNNEVLVQDLCGAPHPIPPTYYSPIPKDTQAIVSLSTKPLSQQICVYQTPLDGRSNAQTPKSVKIQFQDLPLNQC